MSEYDVVVVGAGNAALCAAMAARENGASVLILEKADEDEKGGNSYFTAGGFRFCHTGIEDVAGDVLTDLSEAERAKIVLPPHDERTFYDTLMKVTRHQSEEELAQILIKGSRPAMGWLVGHRIRFIPMFGRQSFLLDAKHHFYGGVITLQRFDQRRRRAFVPPLAGDFPSLVCPGTLGRSRLHVRNAGKSVTNYPRRGGSLNHALRECGGESAYAKANDQESRTDRESVLNGLSRLDLAVHRAT